MDCVVNNWYIRMRYVENLRSGSYTSIKTKVDMQPFFLYIYIYNLNNVCVCVCVHIKICWGSIFLVCYNHWNYCVEVKNYRSINYSLLCFTARCPSCKIVVKPRWATLKIDRNKLHSAVQNHSWTKC